MAEVSDRCWGVRELSRLLEVRIPRWLEPYCIGPGGRHRAGVGRFLGVLCAAQAAGAAGLELSYEEAAAEFGVGRRTWGRWISELAAAGAIYWEASWAEPDDPDETRCRWRARNIYRLGPELDTVAVLETAPAQEIRGLKGAAVRAARELRRRARQWRRDREVAARARASTGRETARTAGRQRVAAVVAAIALELGVGPQAGGEPPLAEPPAPGTGPAKPVQEPEGAESAITEQLQSCHDGTPTRPGSGTGFAGPVPGAGGSASGGSPPACGPTPRTEGDVSPRRTAATRPAAASPDAPTPAPTRSIPPPSEALEAPNPPWGGPRERATAPPPASWRDGLDLELLEALATRDGSRLAAEREAAELRAATELAARREALDALRKRRLARRRPPS